MSGREVLLAISLLDMTQTIVIISGLLAVGIPIINEAGGLVSIISSTDSKFFKMTPDLNFSAIANYVAALITIGLEQLSAGFISESEKACKNGSR